MRQKRTGGSFGSMSSASGLTIGTPKGTMFNSSPTVKDRPFALVGLPSTPRPIQVVSSLTPPRTLSQSSPLAAFALGTNTNGTPRLSGMRMVDLETGVVGVVDEKRRWGRVRSMMGVVGDVNRDEALFEMVAGSPPPLPSPALRQGQGQGQGQWQWQWQIQGQGQRQGQERMQAPRVTRPGKVGGARVLKKPAPLALGGLSNFESSVHDSANNVRRRFVREVITTGKTSTPPDIDSSTNANGRKKMSILQSAVINGRANKEEVELVTGMKMDI